MKPVVFFTKAIDPKFLPMSYAMFNSLRKFHKDIEMKIVRLEDYTTLTGKDHISNVQEIVPLFANEFIKEYELVISLDSDQIFMGDLNYIIDHRKEYDLGVVHNLNRVDTLLFTQAQLPGIYPEEYYNMGLVAYTSPKVTQHLLDLYYEKASRLEFGEQDLLNLIAHYGNFRVKCFDLYDTKNDYYAWHGLKAKGEGVRMYLKDGKVILPKNEDNYPPHDTIIKAYHFAGGSKEQKMNFNTHFKDDMIDYINWLIDDTNEPYGISSAN